MPQMFSTAVSLEVQGNEITTVWCLYNVVQYKDIAGLILGLHPTDEKRRYKVTPSLIGWLQT